mmetsp:Transcript_11333/g.21369  ORF Transcript_11333/g.21369 Transcript_11333/m.21369 type:complete len:200 (+) Transcript_11333:751-1350(+)
MARRHWMVYVPVFLWNLIQCRHCQCSRVHNHTMQDVLQPMLIWYNMCFQKHDHGRSCHLNSLHLRQHQALPFLERKHANFAGQGLQLLFLGVSVAIRYPNNLLHQLIRGEVQYRLHGSLHVFPFLCQPWDDDGDCVVCKIFPLVLATAGWSCVRRVRKATRHVSSLGHNQGRIAQECEQHDVFGLARVRILSLPLLASS